MTFLLQQLKFIFLIAASKCTVTFFSFKFVYILSQCLTFHKVQANSETILKHEESLP